MNMPFPRAAILFLGVACATFFFLESLTEAQGFPNAEASTRSSVETIEVPQGLRGEIKSAFEAAEALLGRERASMESRVQLAATNELKTALEEWEAFPGQRAEIRERATADLEASKTACSCDFLALVTLDNEVILARGPGAPAASVLVRSALIVLSERFFREGKALSGFEILPRDIVPLTKGVDSATLSDNTICLLAGQPLWVRPDAPAAVLLSGVSLSSFSQTVAKASAAPPGKVRWHAFVDDKSSVPSVIAGGSLGSRVRTSFFQALLQNGSTDEPAFEGQEYAPGQWRALYDLSDQVIGGWGMTANPEGLKKIVQAVPVAPADPWAPVIEHVHNNWPYYAGGAGGFLGLVLLVALVRSSRHRDPARRTRRVLPAEAPSPIVAPPPSPTPHGDSLVSQFELNWKTFASYTQDMLQQKLRELEDAPQRGVKDVREQVAHLNQALNELKADLAAARSEVRDSSVGVVEKVASIVEQDSREKSGLSAEDGAVLKKIEGDFEKAASRFSQLDETVGQLSNFLTQKKNAEIEARVKAEVDRLEAQWREKVAEFTAEIEEAKQQGRGLLEDAERARELEALLRAELGESKKRTESLIAELNEKTREVDAVAKEREIAWRREREAQEQLTQSTIRAEAQLERNAELEDNVQRLNGSLREASERESALARKARESAVEADRLRSELQGLQKEAQDLRTSLARKEKELEDEKSKLSDRVKTLNALVSQVNDQSREVQIECERLQGLLSAKEAELAAQGRALAALREEKGRIETSWTAGLAELESLRAARASFDSARFQKLEAECARLAEEAANLEKELRRERHELANTQQAFEMSKIEADDAAGRLAKSEREIQRLRTCVDAERAEAQRARSALEQRERQMKPEKEALEKALEASLAETKRLRTGEEELSRLRKELAELESSRRSQPEIVDPTPRLGALEKERRELLESIDKLGKELERARTESEGIRSLQGTLVDGCIPAAIVAFDTSLRIFAWNSKAEGLWGKDSAAAIGRQVGELGLKGLDRDAAAFAHRALREKRSVSLPQCSFTDHKSKVRHVRLCCDPIVGPRGEVLGGVLVAEEITEKVEHEIEARLQTLFSQSLAKSMPGALVVIDTQSRVISWNRNAELILGVPEKQALGENFFQLPTALSKETFRRHFESTSKDRNPHRVRVRFEYAGVPTQFVVTQAPFLGNDDAVRGTILLVQEAAEPVEVRR